MFIPTFHWPVAEIARTKHTFFNVFNSKTQLGLRSENIEILRAKNEKQSTFFSSSLLKQDGADFS